MTEIISGPERTRGAARPAAADLRSSALLMVSKRIADERAHDVLAAEEFGVPAPDPALHHGPVKLPSDPTGIAEPHDVLAAEEFALPAPPVVAETRRGGQAARWSKGRAAVVALGAAAVLVARNRRRRA